MHFSHLIVSSLVHGVIYGVIYKVIRHLTLPETFILAAVVLAAVWLFTSRRGDA